MEGNKQRRSEHEGGYPRMKPEQESTGFWGRLTGRGLATKKGQKMKDVFTDFETFSRKDKRLWNRLQTDSLEEQKKSAGEFVEWLNEMYKGFRKPKNVKKIYDNFLNLNSSSGVKLSLAKRLNLNKTDLNQLIVNIKSSKLKALNRALIIYKRVQKKNPNEDFLKIIDAIESRIRHLGNSFSSKIKRM